MIEETLFFLFRFVNKNLHALKLYLPNNAALKCKTILSLSNPVFYTSFSFCDGWRGQRMIISHYNSLDKIDVVKITLVFQYWEQKKKSNSDHIWKLEICILENQHVGQVIPSILHILDIMLI